MNQIFSMPIPSAAWEKRTALPPKPDLIFRNYPLFAKLSKLNRGLYEHPLDSHPELQEGKQ
jgi:hypothetical protein